MLFSSPLLLTCAAILSALLKPDGTGLVLAMEMSDEGASSGQWSPTLEGLDAAIKDDDLMGLRNLLEEADLLEDLSVVYDVALEAGRSGCDEVFRWALWKLEKEQLTDDLLKAVITGGNRHAVLAFTISHEQFYRHGSPISWTSALEHALSVSSTTIVGMVYEAATSYLPLPTRIPIIARAINEAAPLKVQPLTEILLNDPAPLAVKSKLAEATLDEGAAGSGSGMRRLPLRREGSTGRVRRAAGRLVRSFSFSHS